MRQNGSLRKLNTELETDGFEAETVPANGSIETDLDRLALGNEPGLPSDHAADTALANEGGGAGADAAVLDLDAERLFAASIGTTKLLSRDEEADLARQIVRARLRVRRVIRQARRLARAALAGAGRGVVTPEADFREREAVAVLEFARRHLADTRPTRATGLNRKQLRAFVREFSGALADYRELRDRMAESNIRLVNMLARQYRHPTITFLDLVQEGTLGLFRAIEKYEPGRKVKFSTYAVWWIWQAIARAVDNQGALIRTPVHWSQFRRRLSREAQAVASDNAATGMEKLPSTRGIDPTRVTMMAQSFRYVSTDAPVGEDDQRPLEAMLASGQMEPEEQIFLTDLRQQLDEAIATLPSRDAYILRHRFGLRDDRSQTLEEIGTRFGVSRERVRQLESRALKQLREVCRARGLQAYLQ